MREVIVELWDCLLEFEIDRCRKHFIAAYAMLGISMVYTPREDLENLYETLKGYLDNSRVVCVGEIGFEPSSKTCPDLGIQEELVRRQVRLAKEANVCLDFHVPLPPDQKRKYSEKCLENCQEYDFPMHKVAVDHCTAANLETALDAGAYAAIREQTASANRLPSRCCPSAPRWM